MDADVAILTARINSLEARIANLSQDDLVVDLPVFPPGEGGATGYNGPFRIYVDGTTIKIDSGYITRIGVPRELYGETDFGPIGDPLHIACVIEYQTLGHDTVSFGAYIQAEPESNGGLPLESRNFHVIVLADVSLTGEVIQRHFGDIEYIHFDRCVSCT